MSPAAVDEPVAMSTEPLAPLAERPVPSTRRPVSAPDAVLASDEDSETSPVDAPAGPPLPLPIDTEPLGPDAAVPPAAASPLGTGSPSTTTAAPPGARWCDIDLHAGAIIVYGPEATHTAVNLPGLEFTFVTTDRGRLAESAEVLGERAY